METNTALSFLPGLLVLGFAALWLIPYLKICSRTGMSKWTVLIVFIPIVGWFAPWIIAFSDWPMLRSASQDRPQKGILYSDSEKEDFKRRGLM